MVTKLNIEIQSFLNLGEALKSLNCKISPISYKYNLKTLYLFNMLLSS